MVAQQNHNFHSPLRYPGGKGALANFMKLVLTENQLLDGDYVEVYAGGAGIAWSLLLEEYVQRVHINDLNTPLMAMWESVLENTEALCRLIRDTPVSMTVWSQQRRIQASPEDHSALELGFSTFFLNRTNRSGILNGGVIGGKDQAGVWRMDARYNKQDLIQRIQRIARYGNRVRLYNLDAVDFIEGVLPNLPEKTFVYLDPPYFQKGQDLYENHYHPEDHANIANLVSDHIWQPWLISYDAAPEIIELYEQHQRIDYSINYSAQDHHAGSEVIFYNGHLRMPEVGNPITVKLPLYARLLL